MTNQTISRLAMKTLLAFFLSVLGMLSTSALIASAAEGNDDSHRIASTLSRPETAERKPDDNGFIPRWLILEPIPARGLTDSVVQAAVQKEYFPDQLRVMPRDGEKVTVDGAELTWRAVDTNKYNVNLFHFARAFDKPTSSVLFWAVTIVNSPEEISDVRLAIGSNAASVWWLNGEEVIGIYNDRQTVIDDGVSKRLTLKKGRNVIRCAVINAGGATDFCARILDANDDPLTGFTMTLNQDEQ